ncbi:MAG: flavodoxin family protein [Elusimicrobia bacterium]|nr:flavodoxin family protein [Elusimicrobiota bacterium]
MKKDRPLVYLIGSSIRNIAEEKDIIDGVRSLGSEMYLYEYLEKKARSGGISNSEGGLIAAAYGCLRRDVRMEYLRLNRYFREDGSATGVDELIDRIASCTGMIFSLPVYFGDRSSLFEEFIEECDKRQFTLDGKVCGFISAGAKRNGGQETTNIYAISDVVNMGALAVGNGPPTCQYGGTCVGGNKGTMADDYFGILTSMGTGNRVASISEVIRAGAGKSQDRVRITFLIMKEKGQLVRDLVSRISQKCAGRAEFRTVDLNEYHFSRCRACDVCPSLKENKDYRCIINDDDMKKIQPFLTDTDALVVCGVSTACRSGVESVYQRFVERSRYLRRDDFRLTNRLLSYISLQELDAAVDFGIRAKTSFIRHNMILVKGADLVISESRILNERLAAAAVGSLIEKIQIVKAGLGKCELEEPRYADVGYAGGRK